MVSPLVDAGLAGVFGLLVGSFLNVVIYRLPKMMEREWREQCRTLLADGATSTASPAERVLES